MLSKFTRAAKPRVFYHHVNTRRGGPNPQPLVQQTGVLLGASNPNCNRKTFYNYKQKLHRMKIYIEVFGCRITRAVGLK